MSSWGELSDPLRQPGRGVHGDVERHHVGRRDGLLVELLDGEILARDARPGVPEPGGRGRQRERYSGKGTGKGTVPAKVPGTLWQLLDAARADDEVARALEAKGNPAILEMKKKSRVLGYEKGHVKGRAEGHAKGRAEAILTVLTTRGLDVSDEVRERILATEDLELLDCWLRRASVAASVEDVLSED